MDPDRSDDIVEHLKNITEQVGQMNRRLQRVEDAIGPVERLAKVTSLAYWRGASAATRESRATLADTVRDVLAGLRTHPRDAPRPASPGEEPPAASGTSLGHARHRRAQVAGCAAVAVLLAATLTYAAWEPDPAGDTTDSALPLPVIPQPAPTATVTAAPSPAPSPAPDAGDAPLGTGPAGPAPGRPDRRRLVPPGPAPGPATRDTQPLLTAPPPAATSTGACSGLGVQVRRIEVCRRRP